MKIGIMWLGVVALAVSQLVGSDAEAQSRLGNAFLGSWEYDASASSFDGQNPYQGAAMRFTVAGKGFHTVWDFTVSNGAKFHFEYDDPGDGSITPVAGNPYYNSQSTVWPDGRTHIRTERRDGKVIGFATMVLAADGKSYTATSQRIPPSGKAYTAVVVWKRVDR